MVTLSLHLEIENPTPELEAQIAEAIAAHLTDESGPLVEDFGPDAWGGYEGPSLTRVAVSQNGIESHSWSA